MKETGVVIFVLAVVLSIGVCCQGANGESAATSAKSLWSGDLDAADWASQFHMHKRASWGMGNAKRTQDSSGKFTHVLRVEYPKGSVSPTYSRNDGAPVGGAQFFADLGLKPRDSLHLRYYVRFADDFNFVKGGKLPGLFGGTVVDGKKIPDGTNGFSTRLMWRKNGDGEVYAYLPTSKEHGTSLGRGSWRFLSGKWHLVEQEVVLNTPSQSNGRIRVWFDEKPVLDQKSIKFRTTSKLRIEGLFFCTFFGGQDASWGTPKTTHADFAGFAVSDQYIGPR